jgi:hypothetical protein
VAEEQGSSPDGLQFLRIALDLVTFTNRKLLVNAESGLDPVPAELTGNATRTVPRSCDGHRQTKRIRAQFSRHRLSFGGDVSRSYVRLWQGLHHPDKMVASQRSLWRRCPAVQTSARLALGVA